ncbi:MAG: glycosyltransferase family 2 protein [Chloroflexi bacterium]|nr:glycosyltransferase family 2 protein [Chloroflexota bacterium]
MPAFNEEANIQPMIEAVLETFRPIATDLEVIVVDDGSRDGTARAVQAIAAHQSRVRLVQHPKNRGYGAALYSGFTAATKEWIFLTDSDRQFNLNEFQNLLPHTSQADLVIGYRAPRRDPIYRRLNGWGWNFLVNLLFGATARDVDCAFKLFKREILDHITILSRGATFSAEFLVRAKRAGYQIFQVRVSHFPRRAGQPTGARPDVIVRAFRELIRVRFALWRGN